MTVTSASSTDVVDFLFGSLIVNAGQLAIRQRGSGSFLSTSFPVFSDWH